MTLNELEKLASAPSIFGPEPEAKAIVRHLIAVARAAQSLMSEDGAREAVAHFNCLHILADRLAYLSDDCIGPLLFRQDPPP